MALAAPGPRAAPADRRLPLLEAMTAELGRTAQRMRLYGYEPPYFASFQLKEVEAIQLAGRYGAMFEDQSRRERKLLADVRVGSYELDSSGPDEMGMMLGPEHQTYFASRDAPLDDDPASPTYYDGPFGRKPYMTRNDSVTNVDDAIIAARGILNRRKTAARDVTLDAVYQPLLQPLDSVFLLEEGMGVQEAHTIESIDLPLVGGKMSMKTFRWLTGLVIWRELRANKTWEQVPPATTWSAATKVDAVTPA
jgi:hypothetical protein